MTCDIFIRTYANDLPWLKWALLSLKAHWKTDSRVVINCDGSCIPIVESMESLPKLIVSMETWPDGYMFQQWTKLTADQQTDAEIIVFLDSDCVMKRDASIDEFFSGQKLLLPFDDYTDLETPWQNIVTEIMNLRPEREFMRRQPLVYHRSTLAGVRKWIEDQHRMPLHEYMLRRPRGSFSEFNCVGFWASIWQPDMYELIRAKDHPSDLIAQHYSWAGEPWQSEQVYYASLPTAADTADVSA